MSIPKLLARGGGEATPIWFVTPARYAEVRGQLGSAAGAFADAARFEARAGCHLLLPGDGRGLGGVLFGLEPDGEMRDLFLPGRLPMLLPDGCYRFANAPHDQRLGALAFALGGYRFGRYRQEPPRELALELSQTLDRDDLTRVAEGVCLARDLINTPANDMGPAELEAAARDLAARHGVERARDRRR